ncbi:hypothetical protein [Serratia plymuthica]|uniref:hypothetical protein n=1 Tax=Serratia plymuthica TaxID=82996 RepID=UPI000935AF8D|nr:hypothetical protein [Serratia plymuthica]OJT36944.1 hypothetical protein BSR04_21865 [Serratia plymuthica]
MAGFLLSGVWTLHRTSSIIQPEGLTLRANAEALFNTAQAPVVRVRSPYLEEPAYGGFFAFWGMDSSCGPKLKHSSQQGLMSLK